MHESQPSTARPGATHALAGTARFITRSLLVASQHRRYAALLPAGSRERYRRLLLAAGDRGFVHAAGSRAFRAAFLLTVQCLLPGIILHYLARKRQLEEWLRHVSAPADPSVGHCKQIVVLGAGLDTLAWRWHEARTDLAFIELDRRAALDIKHEAMNADGSPRRNLTFVAADLGTEPLAAALRRSPGFAPSVPTLFLAEGLLMYLPPARVQALCGEIAALATAGTGHCFAFTFMEARADGRIGFRRTNPLVNWWLRRQGEPFQGSQAPAALATFLASAGFTLRELVSSDLLRTRYLAPAGLPDAPLAVGEWLALARTKTTP